MGHERLEDAFDRRAAGYDAARIRQYNEAIERYPTARETERRILIDLLALRSGVEVCDVAAGGGYLADGIYARLDGDCRILCLENSAHFSESLPDRYERVLCSLSDIKIETSSVDRVACLAGVHHQEQKQTFFDEAFRILRTDGRIAVGDVLHGSAPARFLNEAVNRWSDLGHDGIFLEAGELTRLMRNSGFVDVVENVHEFTWDFPSFGDLVWFCKTLFRMTNAELDDVEAELRRYIVLDIAPNIARMRWSLVYASARRAQ
jgi:cyclopropane fatty-acyl-phospholipid synthase-like methyltransferase